MPEPKLEADFDNQIDAAKYAGVTVRTIQRWKARGMPVVGLGGGKVGYTKKALDLQKRISQLKRAEIIKTQDIYAEMKKTQNALDGLKVELETILHISPDKHEHP